MGKKSVKFPSVFNKRSTSLPFRAGYDNSDDTKVFKTVNSIFLDPCINIDETCADNSSYWLTKSENSPTFFDSSDQSSDQDKDDQLEMIIRGARSDRLFFEPCNSKLSTNSNACIHVDYDDDETMSVISSIFGDDDFEEFPFKESVVLAMDSEDLYGDFKGSMLEMVESHGLKDWECLEELLEWYLRMNGKMNHAVIVKAFVDLLLGLASSDNLTTPFSSVASSSSTSTTTTTTSPLSTVSGKNFDQQNNLSDG